jgi:hypothetical protein
MTRLLPEVVNSADALSIAPDGPEMPEPVNMIAAAWADCDVANMAIADAPHINPRNVIREMNGSMESFFPPLKRSRATAASSPVHS